MADPLSPQRRSPQASGVPRLFVSGAWRLVVAIIVAGLAVMAVPAVAPPAAAAPEDDSAQTSRFAEIAIDSFAPTMVTTSSPSTVTVTGHVVNTSGRTLSDLGIRLERGDAVAAADGLRSALTLAHPPVVAATAFSPLGTAPLGPGEQRRFSLSVPLSAQSGLQISAPGVYPLQLNVNALPDYGGMAQVASSRTLLPVLSLPPDRTRAASYIDPVATGQDDTVAGLGPDGSVSAATSSPAQMTMLWPLAASPQLAPGVLGGNSEPIRLISEDLARSVAAGGRLRSLLTPLHAVVDPEQPASGDADGADPSSEVTSAPTASGSGSAAPPSTPAPAPASDLARSMCLAVDPDLLVTVRAMSRGYVVSTDPANPAASTVPGTGQADAASWLAELREIAARMCVVALPFADADLTALARIRNSGLTAAALDSPAGIVDSILGIRSVRGITIPGIGAINTEGAQAISSAGISRVVTSAGNVATSRPTANGRYRVGSLAAQTYDQPVSAALAALGTRPTTPALTPADQRVDLSAESPISRRQAALGALAYTAIAAPSAATAGDSGTEPEGTGTDAADVGPVTGRSALVMPSLYWSPTAEDADALLSTATVLLGSAAARPAPLTQVVAALGAPPGSGRLVPVAGIGPVSGVSVDLPAEAARFVGEQADLTWRFQGSLVSSADVDTSPQNYLAPLREDLLRAITTPSEVGGNTATTMTTARDMRIGAVGATLGRLRSAVAILDPGGRYTLASERSPLLLVVRNDLALPVRVTINTRGPQDLDIGDIGAVEIPARGTRQIQLPTRAQSSESAITVTISMATVTGVDLGSPITLSVHSNAYGMALFIITIVAAAALVLLTARRLWRRFRGHPDPADADRPEPDDRERMLAATNYQQRRRTLHSDDDPASPDEHTGTDSSELPPGEPEPHDVAATPAATPSQPDDGRGRQ